MIDHHKGFRFAKVILPDFYLKHQHPLWHFALVSTAKFSHPNICQTLLLTHLKPSAAMLRSDRVRSSSDFSRACLPRIQVISGLLDPIFTPNEGSKRKNSGKFWLQTRLEMLGNERKLMERTTEFLGLGDWWADSWIWTLVWQRISTRMRGRRRWSSSCRSFLSWLWRTLSNGIYIDHDL